MAEPPKPSAKIDALKQFAQQPMNRICADCGDTGESMKRTWISTNLGIFLCINCAGIHRSLGTHISTILCLELDSWNDPDQIDHILKIGNKLANECWLSSNPKIRSIDLKTIRGDSVLTKLYIEAKYTGVDFQVPLKHKSPKPPPAKMRASGASRVSAGILRIGLLKGVDLLAVDYNGSSDPYVKFEHSGKVAKSKILKKTLNPEWNQTIMMNIEETNRESGWVSISCWDHNKYAPDVVLGQTKVEIVYFMDELEHFMVLKLDQGELHLNFQFTKL